MKLFVATRGRIVRLPLLLKRTFWFFGAIASLFVYDVWRQATVEADFWKVAEEVRRMGGRISFCHSESEWASKLSTASPLPKTFVEKWSSLIKTRKVGVYLHSDVSREQLLAVVGTTDLTTLRIEDAATVGDEEISLLASHATSLERLHLERVPVGDAGLIKLKLLPRLKTVQLIDTRVTPTGVMALLNCPKLEELELESPAGDFVEPLRMKVAPVPKRAGRGCDVPLDFKAAVRINAHGLSLPTTLKLVFYGRAVEGGEHGFWFGGEGEAKLNSAGEYQLLAGLGGKNGEWAGKHRIYLEVEVPFKKVKIRFRSFAGEVDLKTGAAAQIRWK